MKSTQIIQFWPCYQILFCLKYIFIFKNTDLLISEHKHRTNLGGLWEQIKAREPSCFRSTLNIYDFILTWHSTRIPTFGFAFFFFCVRYLSFWRRVEMLLASPTWSGLKLTICILACLRIAFSSNGGNRVSDMAESFPQNCRV